MISEAKRYSVFCSIPDCYITEYSRRGHEYSRRSTNCWQFDGYYEQKLSEQAYHVYRMVDKEHHLGFSVSTTEGKIIPFQGERIERPESPNWVYLRSENGVIHHIQKKFIVVMAIDDLFYFNKKRMIQVREEAIR